MDASNILIRARARISRARNWLSERARLRRDAEEVARMNPRELRDLGLSHAAAGESRVMLTECGPIAHGSWIDAQPCFPRRALRHA